MKRYLLLITVGLILLPNLAFAKHRDPLHVQSTDDKISFDLPIENNAGGASISVADLGNDGTPEILIGNGLGNEPRVRVLRMDGSEIGSFLAFAPDMGVGINVMTCDLTGDQLNEIIVSPARGGGPQVRVFDRFGKAIDNGGFFAYSESFRGGVNLACGDTDDDAVAELITIPATGGGSHIKVWAFTSGKEQLKSEFFAFDRSDQSGSVGSVYNNQLVLVQQRGTTPLMRTFDATGTLIEEKKLSQQHILSVFVVNENRYVTTQAGDIFSVDEDKVVTHANTPVVASQSSTNDINAKKILFVTAKKLFDDQTKKRILVDLSEQRLYAYNDGVLENSFLISSGINNLTPLGKHAILAKIYEVDYRWSYGVNDPRNYDLGVVPYNLRFFPHIYLHYAYWHNNFGHVMSHGCVNVSLTNMKWLYNWAEKGDEVNVRA